jgi:predicted nucleic acid-binding protein
VILLDASVWIDHIRSPDQSASELLDHGEVLCHPFVIGEVGMGQFRDRRRVLEQMRRLEAAEIASDDEVMVLVDRYGLFGRGIGYVDAHLLAAAFLTPGAKLWTRDKQLRAAAVQLKLAAEGLR